MGWKVVETMHNTNNAFGPRTTNKCTVYWWFKKFCKGDKRLENEENSGWPLEIGNDQLRGSSNLILCKLHEKLPKNLTSTILWSFSTWSKLERWKSSTSRCLMSLVKMKKNQHFEVSSSLILHNNNVPFLNQIVICDEKWILYDNQQ